MSDVPFDDTIVQRLQRFGLYGRCAGGSGAAEALQGGALQALHAARGPRVDGAPDRFARARPLPPPTPLVAGSVRPRCASSSRAWMPTRPRMAAASARPTCAVCTQTYRCRGLELAGLSVCDVLLCAPSEHGRHTSPPAAACALSGAPCGPVAAAMQEIRGAFEAMRPDADGRVAVADVRHRAWACVGRRRTAAAAGGATPLDAAHSRCMLPRPPPFLPLLGAGEAHAGGRPFQPVCRGG